MFAVIKTGGKQYRVSPGDVLKVETLADDDGVINFDQVLMISDGDQIDSGKPFIDGAQVTAKLVSNGRAKKVKILKFKRRKHHMKRMGHRQNYTEVEITQINAASC